MRDKEAEEYIYYLKKQIDYANLKINALANCLGVEFFDRSDEPKIICRKNKDI